MTDSQDQLRKVLERLEVGEPSSRDKQIHKLETDLQAEKDGRREDRFLFFLALLIVADVWFFSMMETWAGVLAVFAFELVGVTVIARRCGVDEFELLVQKVLSAWSNNNKK